MILQSFQNAVGHQSTDAPVCYFHIPRTGGAAVYAHLENLFTEDEVFSPGEARVPLEKAPLLTADSLSGCKVFYGPYSNQICPHIQIPIRYFTFLRDPLIRAVSQYQSILGNKSHRLYDAARSLGTFGAYLRNETTQPSVANCELRYLGAAIELSKLTDAPRSENLARGYLDAQLEIAAATVGTSQLLETALARLDQMCFVGLAERLDESLRLMCELFEWPPAHFANTRVNATRDALLLDAVSPTDLRLLKRLNEADIELYVSAKSRFERDWNRSRFVYPNMHAFVSYAQNAEDVILHRALHGIKSGFYIDVGANDPTGDSVTKAFYERGWRGINIEPVTTLYEILLKERPEDININAAAGARDAHMTLYEFPGTGLSTLDYAIAKRHREIGFEMTESVIEVRTLASILNDADGREVHFLKIDVEGWELDVLRGMSFDSTRPWIVVVEATEPNTNVPSYQAWESVLTNHRYAFAFFDGLNRYYLAEERDFLREAFSRPVNSSDFFIRASEKQAHTSLRESRWKIRRQNHALAKVAKWAKDAESYARSLELERVELKAQLAASSQAHESERIEYVKQVEALTTWAASADQYANSLVAECQSLRAVAAKKMESRVSGELNAFTTTGIGRIAKQAEDFGDDVIREIQDLRTQIENMTVAHATEHRNAILEINGQKRRAEVAEEYAKSLEEERITHQVVYKQLQSLRDREHSDAISQIEAQQSRAMIAEEYAQSLLNDRVNAQLAMGIAESTIRQNETALARLPHLESELADRTTRLEELTAAWQKRQKGLESKILRLTERLREWDDKGRQHSKQVRDMLESNFRSANAWQDEKQQLTKAVAAVETSLRRLRKHWAVRYLVSNRFLENEEGS